LVKTRVVSLNRPAKYSGIVVIPFAKYRGKKNTANATNEIPAITSHAITVKPSANAAPLSPTSCSVDRLVSSSDPATKPAVKLRPAKK